MKGNLAEIIVPVHTVEDENVCKPVEHNLKFIKWEGGMISIEHKKDAIYINRLELIKLLEFLKQEIKGLTEHDLEIMRITVVSPLVAKATWEKAFTIYNSENVKPLNLQCRQCFGKVYEYFKNKK